MPWGRFRGHLEHSTPILKSSAQDPPDRPHPLGPIFVVHRGPYLIRALAFPGGNVRAMNPDPISIPTGPFTLATGRALGLTDKQLRGSRLHAPTSGVRTAAAPDGTAERARAISLVLPPSAAFSHLTAAKLHGWPLSYAMERDERLHVIDRIDRAHLRRHGLVGHRALHHREVVTLDGLPVVAAADTWVDLGELVGRGKPVGLDDLIVAGDAAATALGQVAPLRVALERRVRPRGKMALLEALEWIRVGSASARETICRLMFVRAGLPEPLLNHPIYASWDRTRLLGIADLYWEITRADGSVKRLVGEYQGAEFHSSPLQRGRDARRARGLEGVGCRVEEIWNDDVNSTSTRHETVKRFAGELEFPLGDLDLEATEPRFFSRHALELAAQRAESRRRRFRGGGRW